MKEGGLLVSRRLGEGKGQLTKQMLCEARDSFLRKVDLLGELSLKDDIPEDTHPPVMCYV